MARGRSNTSAASRDPSIRSLTRALSMPLPGHFDLAAPFGFSSLNEVEDGRLWHPDPDAGALTIGGRYARVIVHSRPIIKRSQTLSKWGITDRGIPIGVQVPVGIKYHNAFNVINCVRRKVRKQVLFARKKTGRGKSQRMPRYTWKSAIWC